MKGKRFILLSGEEKAGQNTKAVLEELCVLNRNLMWLVCLKKTSGGIPCEGRKPKPVCDRCGWIRMCMESKAALLIRFAKRIWDKLPQA